MNDQPINIQPFQIDPRDFQQLQNLVGVYSGSAAPTFKPPGNRAAIFLYKSGATYRLYGFVPADGTWYQFV